MTEHPELGRVGVWIAAPPGAELARVLEQLGYGAIWIGGSQGGRLAGVEATLAATSRLTVATGVVNIWKDDAAGIAAAYHRMADRYSERFLLGVGATGTPSPTTRSSTTSTRWTPVACHPASAPSPHSARRCCGWRPTAPRARTPTW